MNMVFRKSIIFMVGSVLLTASCAAQPTAQDLAASIIKANDANPELNTSEEQALCMAEIFLGSDISDTSLSGLAKNFKEPTVLKTEKKKVNAIAKDAAAVCKA